MRLLRVRGRNVFGYKELDFPLADRGQVYIYGPNGAGKSSIPATILWLLTGESDRVKLADQIVRRGSSGGAEGTIDLVHGDHELAITRYRRHVTGKNAVKLVVDGKDVSPRHIGSADELVQQYVANTYDDLSQSLFFATDTKFFSTLQEAEQKRVLRRLFRHDRFTKAGEEVKARARAFTEQFTAQSMLLERALGEQAEAERTERAAEAAFARAKQEHTVSAKRLAADRKRLGLELKALAKEDAGYQAELDELLDHKAEAKRLAERLEIVTQRWEELRETKRCPTCGRPWPHERHTKEIEDLHLERRTVLKNLKRTEGEIDEAREAELDRLITTCEERQTKLERQFGAIDQQLQFVDVNLKSLAAAITNAANHVKNLTRAAKRQRHRVAKLEASARHWEWWRDGFGSRGIETVALARRLPAFNRAVNAVLARLPTDDGVLVYNLHMDGDHLVQQVEYQGSGPYALLSGGERRRLDFSIAYAYHRFLPRELNLWWLDEPFENLDALGIEGALGVLANAGKESVFFTSQRDELAHYFPTVIELRRREIVREERKAVDVTRLLGSPKKRRA